MRRALYHLRSVAREDQRLALKGPAAKLADAPTLGATMVRRSDVQAVALRTQSNWGCVGGNRRGIVVESESMS